MEDKPVRITLIDIVVDRFWYFICELISIIVIKSILKDELIERVLLIVKSDEDHRFLNVEIDVIDELFSIPV